MGGNSLAVMEYLDGTAGDPCPEFLPEELMWNRVIVPPDIDVVVEPDTALLPFGIPPKAASASRRCRMRMRCDHAALKRLLGYRQSFRSLQTAMATLSGIETIRTIKRGHIHHKKPGLTGEIEFIARLFDAEA